VHLRGRDAVAEFYEGSRAHIHYSNPTEQDRLGVTHDSEGRVDVELIKCSLPFDDYDFYLCGPTPFMQSLHDGLTGLGVREERIRFEAFGPATVLKHDAGAKPVVIAGEPVDGPVSVRFAGSDVETDWSPDKGTLFELAEEAGLSPQFSCRSGICGTCATRIKCGAVDYIEEPVAPHGEDEVLICCSTPRSSIGDASCGEDQGAILDL